MITLLRSRFIPHISFGFIILFAFITVLYELSNHKTTHNVTKIYPYFSDIKHDIQKIDIRFPEKTLNLQRTKDGWVVASAENFTADTEAIDRLFYDIENMILVTKKTQNHAHFKHLNLLNPSDNKVIDGEGIRFTFYGKGKSPYADFIVGDRLKSYISQHNMRLFVRYGTTGGAYLAQTTSDFQHSASHFLSKNFGMPALSEVTSAQLILNNQDLESGFKIYKVVDDANKQEILFSPSTLPKGKKLLYPMVMRDYMVALTQQLRPLDVMYLPLQKSVTETEMVLELTKGRVVRITFWQVKDNSYMRIIRGDIQSDYSAYVYKIANSDYASLIQPLERFLTTDESVTKPIKPLDTQ